MSSHQLQVRPADARGEQGLHHDRAALPRRLKLPVQGERATVFCLPGLLCSISPAVQLGRASADVPVSHRATTPPKRTPRSSPSRPSQPAARSTSSSPRTAQLTWVARASSPSRTTKARPLPSSTRSSARARSRRATRSLFLRAFLVPTRLRSPGLGSTRWVTARWCV